MVDLETLGRELARRWGEDAAQHALLRIVEKGWHLDPGVNEVERFARVTAKNFSLTFRNRHKHGEAGEEVPLGGVSLTQEPTQERLALARDRLKKQSPLSIVKGMGYTYREIAAQEGIPLGTVKSRLHRRG